MNFELMSSHLLDHAAKEGRYSVGNIWSPGDVGRFTGNVIDGKWFITGAASRTLMDLLRYRATEFQTALEFFQFEYRQSFLVVVKQIELIQHRVLLPLTGETVKDFVASLVDDEFVLYLAEGGRSNGVASNIRVPVTFQRKLMHSVVPLDDLDAAKREAGFAAAKILQPLGLSVKKDFGVPSEVFVTLVCPWTDGV